MTSLIEFPKLYFNNNIKNHTLKELEYLDSCCTECILFRRVKSEGEIFVPKPRGFESSFQSRVSRSAPNVSTDDRFFGALNNYKEKENFEGSESVNEKEIESGEDEDLCSGGEEDEDEVFTSKFDNLKRKNSFALNLSRCQKWKNESVTSSSSESDSSENFVRDTTGINNIKIADLDVQRNTHAMVPEDVKRVIENERGGIIKEKQIIKRECVLKKQDEIDDCDHNTCCKLIDISLKKQGESKSVEKSDGFINKSGTPESCHIPKYNSLDTSERKSDQPEDMVKVLNNAFGHGDFLWDLIQLKAEAAYEPNLVPILKTDFPPPTEVDQSRQHRMRSKSSEYGYCTNNKFERPTLLRRKSVHFADSRGLSLEIRHPFLLSDDCFVPPKLMEELRKSRAEARANGGSPATKSGNPSAVKTSSFSIRCAFGQPYEDKNFTERVRTMKVALEKLTMSSDSTSGTGSVVVENMEYNKNVFVRMSFNKWRSYLDVKTSYAPGCKLPGSRENQFDRFNFTFYIPHNFSGADNVEFAVCYRLPSTGREYWDSNRSQNYILKSLEYHHSIDKHDHFTLLT